MGTMRLQKLTLFWIPERKKMEQNGRNINRPKTRRKKKKKKQKRKIKIKEEPKKVQKLGSPEAHGSKP